MNFVIYANWHELPAGADALFDHSASVSIFSSRPWLEAVSETVKADGLAIVLACVVSEDRVLAILPLTSNNGDTWYALRHRYSPHYHLLLAEVDRKAVIACLAEGLGRTSIRGLILEPVIDYGGDSDIGVFQRQLESSGFGCDYMFRHYNWIHRVRGQSFRDYMATRPTRLRNTVMRKRRKLEREQGYEIRLYTGDDVPRKMAEYYLVYSASWKANEQFAGFVDSVVAGFSRLGWSRLAVLYIKGKPAAAQLWFVHRGKASIFRLSYDEEWRRYSPGSILTAFLMEYVIERDNVIEIDFLTGNETYKQDWMTERRECYALSCVRNVESGGRYARFVELLKRK